MAVVFGVAAATLDRRLATSALVAYLVFALPHLAFHLQHLEPFGTVDAVAQPAALVVLVVLPCSCSPPPAATTPGHSRRHPVGDLDPRAALGGGTPAAELAGRPDHRSASSLIPGTLRCRLPGQGTPRPRCTGWAPGAARAFLRVVNLMDRPEGLLRPAIALRVLGGNLRRAATRPGGWRPAPATQHKQGGLMTATPTQTTLTVDGIRAPMLQAGPPEATDAVVFVHGDPGSSRTGPGWWSAPEPSPAAAWDQPGFRRAEKPAGFDYTVQGYAAHLGRCLVCCARREPS